MTPHLEQRLQKIAEDNGYSWPAGELAAAMRMAAEAATVWYSPDVLPNVKRRDWEFFYVAVRRSNGNVYVFPAVFLNEMRLSWEGITAQGASGNRWMVEPGDDDDFASGWFDFKTHADYDDYYMQLLHEEDELVAWSEAPAFNGKVEHWHVTPPQEPRNERI